MNHPCIHFIVSIIFTAPFGFNMVLVFLSIMNHLVDAYTIYAASVLAANSVLRSTFGAVFCTTGSASIGPAPSQLSSHWRACHFHSCSTNMGRLSGRSASSQGKLRRQWRSWCQGPKMHTSMQRRRRMISMRMSERIGRRESRRCSRRESKLRGRTRRVIMREKRPRRLSGWILRGISKRRNYD